MAHTEVKIDLPWPPSVNKIWSVSSTGQWYSTPQAKEFKQVAIYYARSKGFKFAFPKDVHLDFHMLAYPPDNRKRDLDNLAKVVCDALQDARVYVNDSQIKRIHMEMLEVRKGGMITVTVKRIEP